MLTYFYKGTFTSFKNLNTMGWLQNAYSVTRKKSQGCFPSALTLSFINVKYI